ncbi:MAG: glycosyltransferase [Elusimicrobia bacterium]|nr:glycosyltransferase [Elusimicrobiota bacterium]
MPGIQRVRRSAKERNQDRPTLSLCMLVKDGGPSLQKGLNLVSPWVDEIVLVDNGSRDATCQVAAQHGARILHMAEDLRDFSKARNYALEAATKQWILVIDADEFLLPGDIETMKGFLKNPRSVGYRLFRYNYFQNGGWFFSPPACRLFQRHLQVRYENCVDEAIEPTLRTLGPIGTLNMSLHHIGYTDLTHRAEKVQFYLGLAETASKGNPENHAALWRLVFRAFLLNEHGEYGEADHLLDRFFAMTTEADLAAQGTLRGYMLQTRGNEKEAEAAYLDVLCTKGGHFKLSCYNKLGVIYFNRGDLEKATEFFRLALHRGGGVHPFVNLGICHLKKRELNRAAELFSIALEDNPFLSEVVEWKRVPLKNDYFSLMQDTVPEIEMFYQFIITKGLLAQRHTQEGNVEAEDPGFDGSDKSSF